MRVRITVSALVLAAISLALAPAASLAQTKPGGQSQQLRREFVLFFDQDSAAMSPRMTGIVDQAAKAIMDRQKAGALATVKVIGYSDTADTNDDADRSLKLSADRALAVRNALVAKGVPAEIMSSEGRGKTSLAVKTGEHVSNIRNRRVRIVMFAPGE